MKKIFLLIPILAFALMANAKSVTITPTSPYYSHSNLQLALHYAKAEKIDTVLLKEGTYVESNNYLIADTNIVIMASETATSIPVVQIVTSLSIKDGANVKIQGINFDGSVQNSYDHFIRFNDNSHSSLVLDDCEFYGVKQIVISGQAATHTDSLVVNNCFFHNNHKQAIYFASSDTEGRETCDSLAVTNSTFANTDALTDWRSVIDIRPYNSALTDDIKAVVDHCTFYNNPTVDSGHANVRLYKINNATVSNCVFAHPEPYDRCATYCSKGNIINCVSFNYTHDGDKGHAWGPTVTNCRVANPLFVDPENNDFALHYASPARHENADSYGEPRWSKAIQPIAIPTTLMPVDATISENASVLLGTPDSIFLQSKATLEWAKWKVSVAKDGLYNFTAYAKRTGSTGSQHLEIMVLNPAENDTLKFNSSNSVANEGTISTGNVNLVAGNTYVVKVRNTYGWAESKLTKVEASYLGGAVVAIPDTIWPEDALRSERAFVNEDGEFRFTDDSHTGYIHDQWAKWNVNVAEAAKYKFTANVNSDNGQNYRITLKNEDETSTLGTWYGIGNSSGERKIATELVDLAIGNYVLMIEDTVNWSHGRVVNIVASYEGGNTVNVPGQILAKEAVIGQKEGGHTPKMSHLMGSGDLKYDDNGYNMEEFATWTLDVTKAGEMIVTLNVSNAGHMFSLELYQGNTRLDSIGEITEGDNKTVWDDGNITLPDHLTFPEKGTYTLKLWNNQAHSGGALHGITFERAAIVIDENATENGNWAYCSSDETIDLSIIRTLKGGMYNTICLPIELGSINSMNAAFGAGYELLKLDEATLNGNELVLNFESVETLEAGIPHLIKPVADVVNPSFTGRKIKTTTAHTVAKGVVDFIGNFIVSEVPAGDQNLFLGPNDLLYFSQTATPIKGMRAYFHVNVPGAAQMIQHARIVKGTQVITSVDLVGAETKAVKTIENGQLIITIDGVRYNVMGVKLQ